MRDSRVFSVRTWASKTLRYRLGWLSVVGVVAASAGPVSAANAGAAVSFSRWQGHDRYGTAAALAEGAYPGGAADVVVASGAAYADALAAGYLSGYLHGPILLTDPRSLPGDTTTALAALHARRVHIVGGPQAVDPGVAETIAELPADGGGKLQVTRVAGSNRYETAAAVAEVPAPSTVGMVGGRRTAIVASGANFPDALAGSQSSSCRDCCSSSKRTPRSTAPSTPPRRSTCRESPVWVTSPAKDRNRSLPIRRPRPTSRRPSPAMPWSTRRSAAN